jgi:glucokinase
VGGTKALARVEDARGALLAQSRYPTGRDMRPSSLIALVGRIVEDCRARCGRINAVGLGFPGLVERRNGRVRSSVILDGWSDIALAQLLRDATGLACTVDNDVKNAARAEIAARAALPWRDMLFVSIGTGIGGALAFDGRIVEGASGHAGEIGHVSVMPDGPPCICGRAGCVGTLAGGAALAASLGLDCDGLAAAIRHGDPSALRTVHASARLVGHALGSALNLLNVGLCVIGGGMAGAGESYLHAIAEEARSQCFPEIAAACGFEFAMSGYDAGAIGAALLAREMLDASAA